MEQHAALFAAPRRRFLGAFAGGALFALLALAVVRPAKAQDSVLSLNEALRIAEEQNADVLSAEKGADTARMGLNVAKEGPNPRLSVDYPFGAGETVHDIMLEQPLETGGKKNSRLAVAEDTFRIAGLRVEKAKTDARAEARKAYWSLLLSQEAYREAERMAQINQTLLEIAQKRFEAGDIAESDVIQVRFNLERAEQKLLPAKNQIQQNEIRLNTLLARPPETPVVLEPAETVVTGMLQNVPSPSLETLLKTARENRPDLAIAMTQSRLASDRIALARSLAVPDLTVAGGYLWDPSIPAASTSVGIRVDLPIFNNHRAEIRQAQAGSAEALASLRKEQILADSEVTAAYHDYMTARTQVESDRNVLLAQAEEVQGLAENSYREGRTGLAGVLVAQQSAAAERQTYLADLLSYITSVGALERAAGRPLSEVQP